MSRVETGFEFARKGSLLQGWGLAALAITSLLLVGGLYIGGEASGGTALIAGAVALGLPALFLLNNLVLSRGGTRLTEDGLIVQMGMLRHQYRWSHIESVELDSGFVVKITLNRSFRFPFDPFRMGTDIAGIPILVIRTLRFSLKDPAAFARAARLRLADAREGDPGAVA